MLRIITRLCVFAVALVAFGAVSSLDTEALAGGGNGVHCRNPQCITCRDRTYGQPDLFYNFYAPAACAGTSARMYVAPLPVPAVVGHTYFTYQPFMPHEFMYKHQRTYHRYYDDGRGLTRTSVRWR